MLFMRDFHVFGDTKTVPAISCVVSPLDSGPEQVQLAAG